LLITFRVVEKKLPNEEAEKKFYDELKKKAEKSFDWSKEKIPKKIEEQISKCIVHVKEILEKKKLVSDIG
jgi:polyhydroxyalkanoate synthesis regulator phasin